MAEVGGTVRIVRLGADEVRARLSDIARLRITVFREWPYLYDGTPEYEERYLRVYAEAARGTVIAALDGDRLVGASTALPLVHEPDDLKEPLRRAGLAVEAVFYFGESVLLPAYRGRGIGVDFFREREAAALGDPAITHAAFCAVLRPEEHPRRPADYTPLDGFWGRRGYTRLEGALGTIAWRDLGETEETAKPMQFWTRKLR